MGSYSTSHLLQGPTATLQGLLGDWSTPMESNAQAEQEGEREFAHLHTLQTCKVCLRGAFVVVVAVVSLGYRVLISLGVAVQMAASDGWYNNSAVKDLV